MIEARKYYNDGIKFLNMNDNYRSMVIPYLNNAIDYSRIVIQIGYAYSSKSCK